MFDRFKKGVAAENLIERIHACYQGSSSTIILPNSSEIRYAQYLLNGCTPPPQVVLILPGNNPLSLVALTSGGWTEGVYESPNLRNWVYESVAYLEEVVAQRRRNEDLTRLTMLRSLEQSYHKRHTSSREDM